MKSDFCVAVHALVFLNHKDKVLSSEELADNICTNSARVRKVMCSLKAAGLVETKEGYVGGYRFAVEASRVDLSMIADALGICFVSTNWHSGDQEKPCLVASGMAGIMDEIFDDLDSCCREKLRGVTIADIDRKIFGSGEGKKNEDI